MLRACQERVGYRKTMYTNEHFANSVDLSGLAGSVSYKENEIGNDTIAKERE